jgi:hypothetical protein
MFTPHTCSFEVGGLYKCTTCMGSSLKDQIVAGGFPVVGIVFVLFPACLGAAHYSRLDTSESG